MWDQVLMKLLEYIIYSRRSADNSMCISTGRVVVSREKNVSRQTSLSRDANAKEYNYSSTVAWAECLWGTVRDSYTIPKCTYS
jgi:hypothetical protein